MKPSVVRSEQPNLKYFIQQVLHYLFEIAILLLYYNKLDHSSNSELLQAFIV